MTGVAPNPTTSVVIALIELFSSVIGKTMYLWFFTWLTKRMAQQEEGIIMPVQHYVWERLNDRYSRDAVALQTILREPPLGVSYKRWYRQHVRRVQLSNRHHLSKSTLSATPNLAETFTRTVVIVELSEGGGSNSATINFKAMPDVVSFLLQQQRQHAFGTSKVTGDAMPLEIVFIVNSPGGEVSTYGLASAQMRRLKNQANITTTVCVDKYAASGGFMIASQADKLVAAPFATIGSVGVIVEGLNFYELAKRYGVQPLVIKAGESKNPLSQWGPVTRQDLAQEQSRLEKVHDAFKEFVTEGRPGIVAHAQKVMDGSVYLGLEARSLGLIDVVMTTEEYIFDRIEAGDRVLRLHRSQQGRFNRQQRILSPLDILPHLRSWWSRTLKHFDIQDGNGE
jgi:signal peptide peptidase SppA